MPSSKIQRRSNGAIALGSRTPNHYGERHIDFMTSIGAQIAVAIENARLYTKTKELSENLEKKVEDRTIALQQAYEELKTIDIMKNELISNVTHELRTPLTIVNSSIYLIQEGESDPDKKLLLKKGIQNLDRLDTLIGQLVDYAKISAHPRLENLETADINEIVRKTIEEISPVADKDKITIKTSLENDLPKIIAEKKKIQQILSNLIGNAIKFNKTGGTVFVKTKRKDDFVKVSIKDTGIGISKDEQKKIFDKLYQTDGSITRKYSGTGIGLAIVKSYVEAHGGKIRVKSKKDKGSKFTFTLPIHGPKPRKKKTA